MSQQKTKKQIMENFVTEYGNALIALVSGAILIVWGWQRYTDHVRWLAESKETNARVVKLEEVEVETESATYKMDRPTFKYHTTGEILVRKAHQLFEKGTLKVGDPHPVRYNHRTPGRILSEAAENSSLLISYLILFLGGVLILISTLLFF